VAASPVDVEVLEQARDAARRSEGARQAMLRAARVRQDRIYRLHADGMSIREIARALGVSSSVVYTAMRRSAARARITRT
jgi:DNA-binding CsgD family transcriptional regulator